ncbi:hypothetical protein Tco_0031170 [Tanacetum coccineum]
MNILDGWGEEGVRFRIGGIEEMMGGGWGEIGYEDDEEGGDGDETGMRDGADEGIELERGWVMDDGGMREMIDDEMMRDGGRWRDDWRGGMMRDWMREDGMDGRGRRWERRMGWIDIEGRYAD